MSVHQYIGLLKKHANVMYRKKNSWRHYIPKNTLRKRTLKNDIWKKLIWLSCIHYHHIFKEPDSLCTTQSHLTIDPVAHHKLPFGCGKGVCIYRDSSTLPLIMQTETIDVQVATFRGCMDKKSLLEGGHGQLISALLADHVPAITCLKK